MKSAQKRGVPSPLEESKMRAGVLFLLLPTVARKRVAARLTGEELDSIQKAYRNYRSLPVAQRRRIELSLLGRLRRPTWPVWAFFAGLMLFGAVLLVHSQFGPTLSAEQRGMLFSPLLIGVFAPLFVHLIPPYRFRLLFRADTKAEHWAVAFLTFIGVLWLLASIRFLEGSHPFRADPLSFVVLLVGAISAPFLEELFFREAIPSLFDAPPSWIGHLISATLFGMAHLPSSPEMALYYGVAALLFSALRINTDGLLLPYIAHASANATVLLL